MGARSCCSATNPGYPNNRVVLSCYLAGETDDIGLQVPDDPRLTPYYGLRITAIDRVACTVTDSTGRVHAWHRLILATGSRPRVPSIPGVDLAGVYTFHDLADADRLKARTDVEKEGLQYVAENTGENFSAVEELRGTKYFTAVYADTAVAPVCVSWHNDHQDSPRRDFKVGDVMGGVIIRIPIEG